MSDQPSTQTPSGDVRVLKACPAGTARCNPVPSSYVIDAQKGLSLHRVECVCGWRSPEHESEEAAITAWNTRQSATDELREVLERIRHNAESAGPGSARDALRGIAKDARNALARIDAALKAEGRKG